MTVLRLLGSQVTLATATTVGNNKLIRVLNNTATVQLITQKNAATTTIATLTLGVAEAVLIQKAPSDTLTGIATTLATPVAFAN